MAMWACALPEGAFGFSGLRFYWALGFGDWAS